MLDFKAIARAADQLAPLPPSVARLAALVARDKTDLREIVEIVRLDEALTARLLRAANSAAYARAIPISTVRAAVTHLGTGAVLSLAISSTVRGVLGRAIPEFGVSEGGLWRHSVASALATEVMPRFVKGGLPADAFAAALLHDLGKLLLARFTDAETHTYLLEAGLATDSKATRLRAELEVLGAHHGEVGALVAQRWGLPDTIVYPITYHHSPSDFTLTILGQRPEGVRIQRVCDAVHVADLVADSVGCGTLGQSIEAELDPDVLQRLGLSPAQLQRMCTMTANEFDAVLQRYDLGAGGMQKAA